jgi:hypothetical protein
VTAPLRLTVFALVLAVAFAGGMALGDALEGAFREPPAAPEVEHPR